MELREAATYIRNWMELYCCGDCDLIFYGLPRPLGFVHRSTLALSLPLVMLNPLNTVHDVVSHECAHLWEPGHGHDQRWAQRAQQFGSFQERVYDPQFDRMWNTYSSNSELRRAGERFLERVCDVIDWRMEADAIIPGHVDFTTFAKPPIINDPYSKF